MKMADDALFNLRWDAQRTALLGSVATLYREESFVDTTIVSDGQLFKAHKLLLAASSSYLKHILESVPSQHAVIFMPHISSSDMGNVLRFIYEGEIKISRRSLKSFLGVAKLLRIKGMDFELDEDMKPNIPQSTSAALSPSATPGSSASSKRGTPGSLASTPQSEEETNLPTKMPRLHGSLKQDTRALAHAPHDDSDFPNLNQLNSTSSSGNLSDLRNKHSDSSTPSSSGSSATPINLQSQSKSNSTAENQHAGSVGSGEDMGNLDDSNHSSNHNPDNQQSLLSLSLHEHLLENDMMELERRMAEDGTERSDHDSPMDNDMDNEYDDDDDDDQSYSMCQPEVSLRVSDETFNMDGQQPLCLKSIQSLKSFSLPNSSMSVSPTTITIDGASPAHLQQSLSSLRAAAKGRSLIPKSNQGLLLQGQSSSQLQSLSEGILMRMMREPLHSSSSKGPSIAPPTVPNFFDLAHNNDSGMPAGMRKPKRYVQCTSCSKVLSSLSALKRHMEDVHCARIQGKCIICGRVYSSRNSLLTHVYSAHKKHHDYKAVARIIRESDFEQFATA